ncbi:NAD-dependent deacylase [Hyphococcus sp.]|uniref:NAD-dependent deacylase n=1 Tax=Hyphococcus sp. TaxID=2038636 RepID=UPI00207EB62F|nr:MAG: NAD-dependent protein deacylase [Marinicaulis sp.]
MSPPRNIVILTGSGISAESGVATFRDKDGVWAKYDYRDVATPAGFAANPALVHDFYNQRRRGLPNAKPNAAHVALAKLEKELAALGGALTLITQNVDDLHERGGSQNVLHMHGELLKAECALCDQICICCHDLSVESKCAACGRTGAMRPHVVWFGEMPRHMDDAADAIMAAELFVSIGTSGSVYPAAGFAAEARALNVPTIELNLEPSENAYLFSDARYGPASRIVPAWVDDILAFKSGDRPC